MARYYVLLCCVAMDRDNVNKINKFVDMVRRRKRIRQHVPWHHELITQDHTLINFHNMGG